MAADYGEIPLEQRGNATNRYSRVLTYPANQSQRYNELGLLREGPGYTHAELVNRNEPSKLRQWLGETDVSGLHHERNTVIRQHPEGGGVGVQK